MSHRRKSARPTNKLRRNATDASSVSSDSDVDHSNKMLLEDCISRDMADTLPAPGPSSPQLALPPDLWQDFQALQAATHLDTASLIRRLIAQYGRPGSQDAEGFQQHQASPSGGQVDHVDDTTALINSEVTFTDSGEIVYCRGDDSACSGNEIDVVTPHYHHRGEGGGGTATSASTMQACVAEDTENNNNNDDNDFSALDLSSGAGRSCGFSSSSLSGSVAHSAQDDVGIDFEDGAARDTDSPLDLTVSKPRASPSPPPHRSLLHLQHHHQAGLRGMEAEVGGGVGLLLTGAPEAHKSPSSSSSSLMLSSLPRGGGLLRSATPTPIPAAGGAHPRSAHSARSGTSAPSPCHVTSSLFNLSDLPIPVGGSPRPFHSSSSSAAQSSADRPPHAKASSGSGSNSRSGAGSPAAGSCSKQKMVQHFLSLPAGHVVTQDNLGAAVADLFQKPGGCAIGGGGLGGGTVTGTLFPPDALRHISLASAIQLSPVLTTASSSSSTSPSSSAQSHAHHHHLASSLTTPTGAMQLPTVTSLEFLPGEGEVGGGGERGSSSSRTSNVAGVASQGMASSAVTSLALPLTSGSALFLDVASGGLVATSAGGAGGAGGLTGVSALNFPVMATGAGGLVAIPFLHAIPEAFAAAAAAAAAAASAASQGQQAPPPAPLQHAPPTSSSAPASTSQQHRSASPHHPPPPPPHANPAYVSPPPPYSAAVASVSSAAPQSSRTYKAKIGRPRGQPKTPKVVCKDMKLLTENTLFPGVYTSILKLPWSKRSRGKSSAKIKDVMANNNSKAGVGSGGGGDATALDQQHHHKQFQKNVSAAADQQQQREPGEVTNDNIHHHLLLQQSHQQPPTTAAASDSSEAQHLGLVSVPILVPDGQAQSTVPSSSSSSSSSSVMMVYHNTGVSELGKPVRRRGRPPKLPVLSQLLSDKKAGAQELQHGQFQQQHVLDGQHLLDQSVLTRASGVPSSVAAAAAAAAAAQHTFSSSSSSAFPTTLTEPCIKQEPMDVSDSEVSKLFPALGGVTSGPVGGGGKGVGGGDGSSSSSSGPGQRQQQQHDPHVKPKPDRRGHRGDAVLSRGGSMDGGGVFGEMQGMSSDLGVLLEHPQFQEASLETRFNILANQLGLEIGSPYHASLVYNQATSGCGHQGSSASTGSTSTSDNSGSGGGGSSGNGNNSAMYQQMMLSSRSMVESKPRRRQLNNLIKPSDDCVYTSFRIRPRNSGRRGGKRKRSKYDIDPSSPLYNVTQPATAASPPPEREEGGTKDGAYYMNKEGGGDNLGVGVVGGGVSGITGSAVITERIPGAGEVPQRLYQDLYHCKMCNEMLPADSSMLHTCSNATPTSRASPPLRSCQACGTMYLSTTDAASAVALSGVEGSDPPSSASVAINLCDECSGGDGKVLSSSSPTSGSLSQDPAHPFHHLHHQHEHGNAPGEGFACQPCGVHFVNIADYIQHRRSAHLEKMSRQPRKTHTLKTLPCPATGCPRLFHMQAELSRHVAADHPEHAETGAGPGAGAGPEDEEKGVAIATSTTSAATAPSSPCGSPLQQQRDSTATAIEVDVETVLPAETVAEAGPDCSEEEQSPFTCTQDGCGRRFATPSDLLDHVQSSHEGVSHWPCPLPGCTRQFGAERHLRVHLLIHKDEKPLKCPFCNYRCRQKNALSWHLRKHPEAAGHYRKFATGVSNDC